MNEWLHHICEEIGSEDSAPPSYLLRFASEDTYRKCLAERDRLLPALPQLARLKPIGLIRGFSCPLISPSKLARGRGIVTIEPDEKHALVHGLAEFASKPSAGSLHVSGRYWIPWGVKEIKAPSVWNRSKGNAVRIGVIDTGIDYNHPDLKAAAIGGVNLVHRHLPPIDDNGHGTHIAGTIAAASERLGIIGVAPGAHIYAVKAFDHNGTAFVSDIVYGIDWCVRNRMNIINMSFGMKTPSKALQDAVKAAYRAGTIVVASSGNEGKLGEIDFPARFPCTIAVGATSRQKKIAPFSNRGRKVDLYAPGHKIVSTWLGGKYHEMSGTSMATSHVSGVIALMLSLRPGLTPRAIKEILLKQATDLPSGKRSSSAGEVNALLSVQSALG
ncbi:S8 family peptidase [Paenibacillus aurantius]|uniref:S8 family peptidase n=1 Tax=Paenibacillus aurantius TaxID=2918900 RepID=A0AA96RHS0_9BACL|nr:S8 family peptidase [Paenibacillus aurantius]WNQ14337.1 S8 family peptidase [Paenibacillus aurantius]